MASERVVTVLKAAESALKEVERRHSTLRMQQEWPSDITTLLERQQTGLSGVLEAVADPRFATFFDVASAEEFGRQAHALLQFYNTYPNDAVSIVPASWPHVSQLGAIIRASFIGSLNAPDHQKTGVSVQLDAAIKQLQGLTQQLRQFQSQLSKLNNQKEDLSTDVQDFIAKLQSQFLDDGRRLESEWRAQRKLEQEEFGQALKAVGEARDASQVELQKALASFKSDSTSALESLEAAKGKTIERLAKYEADAAAAVGAVGATAQSAGFERTANEADARSLNWQRAAVALMSSGIAILAGFLGFAAWTGVGFDMTPSSIAAAVTKVALLALLGVLSRYCAAMADRARREHLWAQQRALELRALTPYLENFEPLKRPELRERLLEKYFGVGSTMLAEVATQGAPATATHDAALQGLKYLLDRVPPDAVGTVLSSLASSVVAKKKKKLPSKT